MDEVNIRIAEFINNQPSKMRSKYIAYLNSKFKNTSESEDLLYSTDFDFEDLRLLTSGITNVILEKINIEKIILNISK
jgi:hypothetical protein